MHVKQCLNTVIPQLTKIIRPESHSLAEIFVSRNFSLSQTKTT